MLEELSDEYIPKEVLHREEQIAQIREIFHNFRKNKTANNLVLFGCTGSGKTTIIKKIIKEEDSAIYISCDETGTSYKTIKAIFNINAKTHQKTLELTIKELKKNPRILVFDEIDKIDRAEDFKRLMTNLNTIYRKTMVPIILITLKWDILTMMRADVRKTLLPEKITLPSYNASELRDILNARISYLNLDIQIDEGVVNYISALSARQGSARLLINIILRCIQKGNFSHDFVEDVYANLIKEDWMDFMNDINESEKEFLRALFLLDCDYEHGISAESIEKYLKLTGARISQLINTFEKYSAIKSWHENLGRAGGRRRFVKFASKEIYDDLGKFMGRPTN